jgi:hypothetical protein
MSNNDIIKVYPPSSSNLCHAKEKCHFDCNPKLLASVTVNVLKVLVTACFMYFQSSSVTVVNGYRFDSRQGPSYFP